MSKISIADAYMMGYMQKKADNTPMIQPPQPEVPPMAGQGMGPGMPAQVAGFPMDPAMVQNAEEDEQKAQEMERENKLKEMGQELNDLKYDAKEQKLTSDIYKEKMKIQKQQEDLKQTAIATKNDASLGSMMANSSPGE